MDGEKVEPISMESSESVTFGDSEERWTVESFTRRGSWSEETTECANCQLTVRLDTVHYHALLLPHRLTNPTEESREVVFCSRSCADEWFQS